MKRCGTCGGTFTGDLCPKCVADFARTNTTSPGGGEPEELPFKPGDRFRGLEIVELLGRGGMGVVYKARQPALDRIVALKILPRKLALDPDFQNRFTREAKALASLSHPNIVTVHDFGAEGGYFFFLMEYVDGVNARQLIRDRKLSPEHAFKIIPQLCDALEYAHVEGVVHRDIKPENILIDRKGRVKIADFGLAKLVGAEPGPNLTQTNVVMGTPHYMAPEQFENPKSVDHRADIYSMGVVFYEMLTGELPIGRFDVPSKRVQVDVRLDEVVLKALEKHPDRRYQRASQVKDDVTRVTSVGTEASWAPTVVTPKPEKKELRTNPAAIAAIVAVAVAAIVAILILAKRPGETRPEGPAAEKVLEGLLPEAAAMKADHWKSHLEGAEDLPEHSLTYVLLRQAAERPMDVELLAGPDGLRRAIDRNGRVTALQPEYLRPVGLRIEGDLAHGSCSFEAPGAYRGFVEFTAQRRGDGWDIIAFRCPKGGEKLERHGGVWRATWPEPPPVKDFPRMTFQDDEHPGGYKRLHVEIDKLKIPRNPFLAKSPEELGIFATWLSDLGVATVSRSDLRQGFCLHWYRTAVLAVDSLIADKIEKQFLDNRGIGNRWTWRQGPYLVMVYSLRELRHAFHDLVYRVQTKLGIATEPPEMHFENLLFGKEDLFYGWQLAEKYGSFRLPFTGKSPEEKRDFLGGMRTLVEIKPEEVRTVYAAAFQHPGEESKLWMCVLDCANRKTAEAIAQEASKKRNWQGAKKIEIRQTSQVVTMLFLHSDEILGFENWARKIRERMGHPQVSFDTLAPEPGELPHGFSFDGVEEDPKAILERLEIRDVPLRDVVRGWRAAFKPEGSIVLLEISGYDLRNKLSYRLNKDPRAAWTEDRWLIIVEGPDDLRGLMKQKSGDDPK